MTEFEYEWGTPELLPDFIQSRFFADPELDGSEAFDELDDEEYSESRDGPDLYEEPANLAEVLRAALLEDYAGATSGQMEEALVSMLDTMTPAESFNMCKALRQVEKGASQALADPTVAQTAPLLGGAAGAYFGGPVGFTIGSGLGGAAARALSGSGKPALPPPTTSTSVSAGAPPTPALKPPVAGGSAAAARGLVLTQQPEVLKSLLALALGEQGRKSIDGVPVGAVMNLLATIFAQAAVDADQLAHSREVPAYLLGGQGQVQRDLAAPTDRAEALYEVLISAENQGLAEAVGQL
jgi:hypothetical protein